MNSNCITLFTTFFLSNDQNRQLELLTCLKNNNQNTYIKQIYVFLDGKNDQATIDYINTNVPQSKILFVYINRIPSYGDWVTYSKQFKDVLGDISIFCNADIYIDSSAEQLPKYLSKNESIVCLSRHSLDNDDKNIAHPNPQWSQDLWAISKENILNIDNKCFIDELSITYTGMYRCDNKLAYIFAMRGWEIYNPYLQVKCFHLHKNTARDYSRFDVDIIGGLCFVSTTDSPDKPSELDISVMPIKVGKITKCAINKYLQRNLFPELKQAPVSVVAEIAEEFKPCYTWPAKSIPFREYFISDNLKIFIIENIVHNYEWLKTYKDKITTKHFFFVLLGWNHSEFLCKQTSEIFELLKLNKNNFFFLCNSNQELNYLVKFGFNGDVINQNTWLDENLYLIQSTQKIYNALYIARQTKFKRHYLANKIPNLALIAGGIRHGNTEQIVLPSHVYNNSIQLNTTQVIQKINQSHCGLCLSKEEGASFCSSEYLLCGIPVVSTVSEGGRDVWYDSYNSVICEDTEESVAEAVNFFMNNKREPEVIRDTHIALAKQQRTKFIEVLQQIFSKNEVNINATVYYKNNFINKMRTSTTPNFSKIL